MKVKVSETSGLMLDWIVCEATGLLAAYPKVRKNFLKMWQRGSSYFLHPSSDWAQGGQIIEREGIALGNFAKATVWIAYSQASFDRGTDGPTPLIAAMRCFVASKLGDEVEVPDELC